LRDYIERLWDIKQTFAFITLIIFAIDFILKITNPLTSPSAFKTAGFLVNLIGPMLGAIIQFIVSTRYFLQKSSKHLFIQLFSNIIAGALLGCSVLVAQYHYTHWALISNEPPAWIAESLHLTNIAFINAIVFTSVPVWYLQPVVSVGQCIGMCIAYIRDSHGMLTWILIRLIMNILFLYVVVWMQSRLRWNQFLRNNELDEWNKVYQAILDKNLSKIAVLNADGKVMYTNAEFRSLIQSNENEESLFDSVVNLKLRDSTTYLHTFRDEGFYTQSSKSDTRFRNHNTMNFRKKISTKETRFNGVHCFDNLSALLEHYRDLLSRDKLQNEDQIIFDGKANSRRSTFVGGKRVNNEPEKPKPKTSLDANEQEKHHSKRGSIRILSVSYEVIIRPLKEYKKLILILNDTTKRDLIANLENDSEYKDKVLASVSHELRTPLNGNLGFLQAAIDDKILPQNIRERYLIPAWRTGKILYHVIDDILDYSQSHNEGISLKLEKKPLRETLDYCFWIYEQAFKEKGLTFLRNFHEKASEIFSTDHERVQRVILNLLSNALKFTPKGSVTMQVDCLENSRFRVTVQDTGEGIDHEDIGKLFEERIFKKRVKGKDLQSKGAGLGLKIAHILAQLLGDENEEGLTVQSELKSGSRFSFEIVEKHEEEESLSDSLFMEDFVIREDNSREERKVDPVDISSSNQPMANNFTHVTVPHEHFEEDYEPPSPIPLKDYFKIRMTARTNSQDTNRSEIRTFFEERKNQKVLIVDDDPLNILVLKSFLDQFGVSREGAINGEDAVSKVTARPFDYSLILMDCQMPVMDGFEATRILTKKMRAGELPRIPIVGCTAFNGLDKLTACIKTGMEEVISKPVIKDKLREILKRFTNFREINY